MEDQTARAAGWVASRAVRAALEARDAVVRDDRESSREVVASCVSQRTTVIDLYTRTPDDTTVVCVDELGPLIPRAYPAQPGWTADGNRVKEQVAYWREPEKTWFTADCASVTDTR